ncbi:hypothetical protein KKH36_03350 [Patescibacteria group bacterium]|nr:hypothetical protein [Patescibacteria group bacterium]
MDELKKRDFFKRFKENREKEKENPYQEKKTGRFCSSCGGEVVERTRKPANFTGGRKGVFGPGGHKKFAGYGNPVTEGFHCDICGIEYHKLPPKDLLKAK